MLIYFLQELFLSLKYSAFKLLWSRNKISDFLNSFPQLFLQLHDKKEFYIHFYKSFIIILWSYLQRVPLKLNIALFSKNFPKVCRPFQSIYNGITGVSKFFTRSKVNRFPLASINELSSTAIVSFVLSQKRPLSYRHLWVRSAESPSELCGPFVRRKKGDKDRRKFPGRVRIAV